MENDQQPIETERASTTLAEKTEDDHGGHQLELAGEENQTEVTNDISREGTEDSKTDTDAETTTTVNSQDSPRKSALTKKEERLKKLRELHLRRVHNKGLIRSTR